MNRVIVEEYNLDCPNCGEPHCDIDDQALKTHKIHQCLDCGELFLSQFKVVSRPTFKKMVEPSNVFYVPF